MPTIQESVQEYEDDNDPIKVGSTAGRALMSELVKPVEPPYEISAIRRADAPDGTDGSNWHEYVISFEGSDSIQGFKSGSLKSVRSAVDEMVAQLNERHLGKRGRVNLVPTPKKKKA